MSAAIVEQLRAERHRQGLTLQQLGERMGRKTYQGPWQWESRTNDPRLSNLDQWADALGYQITLTPKEDPPMDPNDLHHRFKFHPATTEARQKEHDLIRRRCGQMAADFNALLPEGREKALVMTKLEEVMFWSNAAIARSPEQAQEAQA